MLLGQWQLDTIDGGRFWLDGGVMFGVVPRTLWQEVMRPDEKNRVACGNNCVLARDGRQTVLIDTGFGGQMSGLERKFYNMPSGDPLLESLSRLGVTPDQVDTVVLSHLHFDHVGGALGSDGRGGRVPTFPRARYVTSRAEWEDATSGAAELQTAYSPDGFLPLAQTGQLTLIDCDGPILPGLRAWMTGGHTRGHMALILESGGQAALFPGDLCPSTAHLRRMWCTAYETYPLETRRRKPQVLGQAADRDWFVLWYHDPRWAVSRIQRHPKREFVIAEPQAKL